MNNRLIERQTILIHSLMRPFIFLFLIFISSCRGDFFPPECWHSSGGRYDPLACWLLHLKVNIPDQSFHSGLVSIEIRSLQCTNFTIGALPSSYQPSSLLELNAQNVSAVCQGSYQVTGGLTGQVSAQATGYDHAMDITVSILSSPADISARPRSVQTTKCQTNLWLENLQFTGSTSAKIVNLFAKQISNYVSEALQQQVCPLFPSKVDPWWTLQLEKMNDWIDRTLSPNETVPPVVERAFARKVSDALIESSIVNLESDIPFFKHTMDWINDVVVQPHLHEGLLPHQWLPTNNDDNDDDDDGDSTCGFFFDGWNGMVQSLVMDHRPDGLHIPLPFQNISILVPNYAQLELQLHNLSIVTGLENWEQVDLLRVKTPTEISTLLKNRNLTLRCDMKIVVQTIPDGMFQGDDLIEYFSIHLHVDSWKALLNLQLDYQKQVLQTLTMETVMELARGILEGNNTMARQSLEFLLEGVDHLEASALTVDMNLSSLILVPRANASNQRHTLEGDLDTVLNNVFQLIFSEYQSLVREILAAVIDGPAKLALNEFFNRTISSRNGYPTSSAPVVPSEQAAMGDFNFTKYLVFLNDFLGKDSTLSSLNQYADCIGSFLSRAVQQHWASSPFDVKPKLIKLESFVIQQLGGFQELKLLAPEGDKTLTTAAKYGRTGAGVRPRIIAVANLFFAPLNITSAINWEANLDDVLVELGSTISYDISDLRRLSLLHVLQYGQCLLTPLAMSFENPGSNLGVLQTMIEASLSSPSWNQMMNISLDSTNYPVVQGKASSILDWAVTSAKDILASTSRSLLEGAVYSCEGLLPPPDNSSEDDPISYSSIFLVIGAVLLFAQPVVLLLKNSSDSSEDRPLHRHIRPDFVEPLLNDPSVMFSQIDNVLAASESAPKNGLMHSTNVPYFVRVLVPIVLLSTACLLLSSNLNVGATVDLVLTSGDEVVRVPPLFGFSLVNTAKEMLQARIYPLFFLVVAFSGLWPYCKLLLMLFSWVAKTSFLSVRRRERLLLALDALSKFSLVDTYVLVLFVVAFRYHLDLSPEQDESSALDVYVTPQFGFYGFLLATALSLVAGHILVYYHRRVRLCHTRLSDSESETLMDHRYNIEGRKFKLSRNFCICIATTLTITVALLGFGMTRECFQFDFGGLGGMLLGDRRKTSYSLLSLGSSISSSVEDPSSSGILFLQVAYYFYAVFTPFATLLFLAAYAVVPLSLRGQLTVVTLAEIANAWSAVEVFALSIVAALLQISTFASFIIGDRCDLIERILDDQGEIDIKSCFSVNASVSWDGSFLFLAVLLNSACVSVVLRLAHLALEERIEQVAGRERDTLLDDEKMGHTFVEKLAFGRWTSWIVDFEREYDAVPSDDNEEEAMGVTDGDEDGVVLPDGIFEEEWREVAEHDPTWKEWKEAESPNQTPDRARVA